MVRLNKFCHGGLTMGTLSAMQLLDNDILLLVLYLNQPWNLDPHLWLLSAYQLSLDHHPRNKERLSCWGGGHPCCAV